MLTCITNERNFFISLNVTGFHCANTNFGFRGPSCFCFFICCVAYWLVSFCICFNNYMLKNISNISKQVLSSVIWKFLFIPGTPNRQVSESSQFFLSILTQNLYLSIYEWPCVLASCLCLVPAWQFPPPPLLLCCCRVTLLHTYHGQNVQ